MEQGAPAFDAAVPILSQLLNAEIAEREVRSTAYQIKAARFPAYKDLAGFDFASSEVNEAMVRQLSGGEFTVSADNVVLKDLLQSTRSLLRLWVERGLSEKDQAEAAYREHRAVFEAIEARDPDAALAAMRDHMATAAERVRSTTVA